MPIVPRIAVVGVGAFGLNHCRVLQEIPQASLAGVCDIDRTRAQNTASTYNVPVFTSIEELAGNSDAAVVAVPTLAHVEVGCELLERGLDVLVEKPIAPDLESGRLLAETAARTGRILAVGHLERFNPAVVALRRVISLPLFFEIHRMSVFTPRSLDVDVVLDLMIHDIDVLLSLTGMQPSEIRAAGIRILSEKVDIANVRLAFENGCVANLTASRVSVERIRKIRIFQPGEYISADYSRQDATRVTVSEQKEVGFDSLTVEKAEPLRLELEAFAASITSRAQRCVTADEALEALSVCLSILQCIQEHGEVVRRTIASRATSGAGVSSLTN